MGDLLVAKDGSIMQGGASFIAMSGAFPHIRLGPLSKKESDNILVATINSTH